MFPRLPVTFIAFFCSLALGAMLAPPAHAQIEVVITKGVHKGIPIAIAPFTWKGVAPKPPLDVGSVVHTDLAVSGRFDVREASDVSTLTGDAKDIDFSAWQARKLDNLVTGSVEQVAPGKYRIQTRLFDVHRGLQLDGFEVEMRKGRLRTGAHRVSDQIFKKLIGLRGIFSTRIAYISESVGTGASRYALHVADYDGYNAVAILRAGDPLLSPAWSPDGQQLAYVAIEKGRSTVYVQQLKGGTRRKIAAEKGINGAPAWAPDGQRIAFTQSYQGNPEIYVYHIAKRTRHRLTNHSGIDTEPTWSPDGQHIVFTSGRSGRPQIYRVATSGKSSPKRLSFQGKYNARASYHPQGKRLLLISDASGSHRVGMLDLRNNKILTLTRTRLDESPTLAPNGAMFMYATRTGRRSVVYMVSDDGGTVSELRADKKRHTRDPAWSPFNPS